MAVAPNAVGADCNGNGLEDACDIDCGVPAGPCDLPGCGGSADCDLNGFPDECDLATGADGCPFTPGLSENTTGADDGIFVGPPDDVYYGLGGQIVTYAFDCGFVVDGPGPDLTVYEVDTGSSEFAGFEIFVSADGIDFVDITDSQGAAVNIPGDETHGSNSFARSYDLAAGGIKMARYVRLDGAGSGAAGPSTGFDLDAIGAIHRLGLDCDGSGTLDVCEALEDCDANLVPDVCELAAGLDPDCNASGSLDLCDAGGASPDCDGDLVPDECQVDCNGNGEPDTCDVTGGASDDCNVNGNPDECDLALGLFTADSGALSRFGSGSPQTFTLPSAFAAEGDVTLTVTVSGDFDASNEYVDVEINGTPVGRVLESGAGHCTEATEALVVDADTFNVAVGGGDAVIELVTPSTVSTIECVDARVSLLVEYDPFLDCNVNLEIDHCDIAGGGSTDVNSNGLPDECEPDCNGNTIPDDWDIGQGTSGDCNGNAIPDECDVASATSLDCNGNVVPDECEIDCNGNTVPDDCDLDAGTSPDCDANLVPDECDLAVGGDGCPFPFVLSENTTGVDDGLFTGPPDDQYYGLGGQIVTYEFDCGFVVDGPGSDLTVYEVDFGSSEFGSVEVLVSLDGASFVSIDASQGAAVNIPGDEAHGSNGFARSYDLASAGVRLARYVRLDGVGSGGAGQTTGFDLDAVGAIHRQGRDCDASGTLDACEVLDDCNANFLADLCELAAGLDPDCNTNGQIDACDVTAMTSLDCNGDLVPDECQADCNTNAVPDDCDITGGTSLDCNDNGEPDECDLALTAFSSDSGPLSRIGSGLPQTAVIPRPFPAAGDVTLTATAVGDLEASGEWIDVDLNGVALGRLFELTGATCVPAVDSLVIPVEVFNDAVAGTDGTFQFVATSSVSPTQCVEAYISVTVEYDAVVDCNANATLDPCDISGGASTDLNVNGTPDDCEPDCNENSQPDDYDIEQGFSVDCNDNATPDECDLASGGSSDCNNDQRPDECAICPPVEVVFIMDTSSSMTDEGAALCADIVQVAADLEADLIDVESALLGIETGGGGIFSCLTNGVAELYGTTVPGDPPAGNEILGDCPGGNEVAIEDWGRATSVTAGLRLWASDVRVIVPISDEGPWCGNPVTDPGVDRDSIVHAIGVALNNDVTVSPITGTGSSAAVIDLATTLAEATGGLRLSSTQPADDLFESIRSVIVDACASISDCNDNLVPDECDLSSGTSKDCDFSTVPDECEADCNLNGLHDDCDIAAGTSDDVNVNAVPDECEMILLLLDSENLLWTPVQGAIGYDVVLGDLAALRGGVGDFTAATDACLGENYPDTTMSHDGDPLPGVGVWYVVRGVLGTAAMSYDSFAATQVESRDTEIDASTFGCD
jgi:hypothetical protein